MRYKVLSPVRAGGKTVKPGTDKSPKYVTLDEEDGDELVELGALATSPAKKAPAKKAGASSKGGKTGGGE